MPPRTRPAPNGFAQKMLVIVLGTLSGVLITFLSWIALEVVEMKVGLAEIQKDISTLSAATEVKAVSDIERNKRRIDELERQNGDGE